MRWLILLHRYLGIGIGWMIALWCLSGLVMIYVPYPELRFSEHVAALPQLTAINEMMRTRIIEMLSFFMRTPREFQQW